MPLKELAKRVANYMHVYTLYSAVRPFGATIMMGSWTEDHGAEVRAVFPKLFELADQETLKKIWRTKKLIKNFPRTITSIFFLIPYSFINQMA
jgi:20S proteasome alpha/beta subunit